MPPVAEPEPGHVEAVGLSIDEMAFQSYPLFAYFNNPRDLGSVHLLTDDEIALHLGAGYKVEKITVEMTNDPVSKVLKSVIPGIKRNEYRFLSGDALSNQFTGDAKSTVHYDFAKGSAK